MVNEVGHLSFLSAGFYVIDIITLKEDKKSMNRKKAFAIFLIAVFILSVTSISAFAYNSRTVDVAGYYKFVGHIDYVNGSVYGLSTVSGYSATIPVNTACQIIVEVTSGNYQMAWSSGSSSTTNVIDENIGNAYAATASYAVSTYISASSYNHVSYNGEWVAAYGIAL